MLGGDNLYLLWRVVDDLVSRLLPCKYNCNHYLEPARNPLIRTSQPHSVDNGGNEQGPQFHGPGRCRQKTRREVQGGQPEARRDPEGISYYRNCGWHCSVGVHQRTLLSPAVCALYDKLNRMKRKFNIHIPHILISWQQVHASRVSDKPRIHFFASALVSKPSM